MIVTVKLSGYVPSGRCSKATVDEHLERLADNIKNTVENMKYQSYNTRIYDGLSGDPYEEHHLHLDINVEIKNDN